MRPPIEGSFATGEHAYTYMQETATNQGFALRFRPNAPRDTMLVARCIGPLDSIQTNNKTTSGNRMTKWDCRYEVFVRYSNVKTRWIVGEGSTRHNHTEVASQGYGLEELHIGGQGNDDPGNSTGVRCIRIFHTLA